jgi:nicotinate-nucleotide pyrophosphorylase (carboxylating)
MSLSSLSLPPDPLLDRLIDLALEEDLGSSGDVTTMSTVPAHTQATAIVRAKQDLVLAGVDVFRRVFARVDPSVVIDVKHGDGSHLQKGTEAILVRGRAHSLLVGERPGLNFLMRLSGIATLTHHMVQAMAGSRTMLVDTRKTTPGWRSVEKAAVRAGGGHNHRAGLHDGVLIKDNHIEAAGGIRQAVEAARKQVHHLLKIEVECAVQAQVEEALSLRVDGIMLDNMSNEAMQQAVNTIRAHENAVGGRVFVEASGNMTRERLSSVAACGVDLISMGALTHQATSVDLSMKLKLVAG